MSTHVLFWCHFHVQLLASMDKVGISTPLRKVYQKRSFSSTKIESFVDGWAMVNLSDDKKRRYTLLSDDSPVKDEPHRPKILLCLCWPQDILYPSEDVEQQLALLSVYPEPDSIPEDFDDGHRGSAGDGDMSSDVAIKGTGATLTRSRRESREGSSSSGIGSALAGGGAGDLSLQGKTDEMLKSISTSFATVTDMFGGKNKTTPTRDGTDAAAGRDAGKGWDRFKPPSVAEMKKRLESMGVGAADTTTAPEIHSAVTGDESKRAPGYPPTPPRRRGEDKTSGSGSGLAKIGESWRDLRRRSAEAVNDAVTKIRSAMDDGDASKTDTTARHSRSISVGGEGISAPMRVRTEDDAFWKPFGDVEDEGQREGGGVALGEPVPLPTAEEARQGRKVEEATRRAAPSARERLNAYYGGGAS